MSKTLHLTLKKKWFDMIASGEKKEEYREIKDYYMVRFFEFIKPLERPGWTGYNITKIFNYCKGYCGSRIEAVKYMLWNKHIQLKDFNSVVFKNGYSKDAPKISFEIIEITTGTAKPEWSDNWEGNVFIIKLGKQLTLKD